MESAFSMTEPDNAGSDPRSIQTTAKKEGDEWVINGHKVMTSNGIKADFAMCVQIEEEGEDGEVNSRMTQIIVLLTRQDLMSFVLFQFGVIQEEIMSKSNMKTSGFQ